MTHRFNGRASATRTFALSFALIAIFLITASGASSAATFAVGPTVAITSPEDGAIVATRNPVISFDTTNPGADVITTTCAIDAALAVTCASPFTTPTLTDGNHTVTVTVADAAGNSSQQSIGLLVDATAPGVTITSPAAASSTTDPTPTVTFTIIDPDHDLVTVECSVDGVPDTGACDSPYTTVHLADGAHSVSITATDSHGNTHTETVSFTITTPVVTPPAVVPPVIPPAAPAIVLPLLGKLPASTKYTKPFTVPITCAAGCSLQLKLNLGRKKVKLPAVKVLAGSTSSKVKFSKSAISKVKAAKNLKLKTTLTVTPAHAAGNGLAKTIKLK